MSITWQIADRSTIEELIVDFENSLTRDSNHLGVYLESVGPTGAQASGEVSNPTTFWTVEPGEPIIDIRGLGGTRGRRYDMRWQVWSEPENIEAVLRDEGTQLQDFLDARTDSGWVFLLEDTLVENSMEFNSDLAGKTIRIPAFVGAS